MCAACPNHSLFPKTIALFPRLQRPQVCARLFDNRDLLAKGSGRTEGTGKGQGKPRCNHDCLPPRHALVSFGHHTWLELKDSSIAGKPSEWGRKMRNRVGGGVQRTFQRGGNRVVQTPSSLSPKFHPFRRSSCPSPFLSLIFPLPPLFPFLPCSAAP